MLSAGEACVAFSCCRNRPSIRTVRVSGRRCSIPSVRSVVRIATSPALVWETLNEAPPEIYHPLVTASALSEDGAILRVDTEADVQGVTVAVVHHFKIVERDHQLRRLRYDAFASQGGDDFLRPTSGGDWVFDVLEAGDACVLVVSVIDVPDNEVDVRQRSCDGYTDGLRHVCEGRSDR